MKVGRLRIGRPEVECIGEKPHRLPRVERRRGEGEGEEQEMAELKGRVHREGRTGDKTKPAGLVHLAT